MSQLVLSLPLSKLREWFNSNAALNMVNHCSVHSKRAGYARVQLRHKLRKYLPQGHTEAFQYRNQLLNAPACLYRLCTGSEYPAEKNKDGSEQRSSSKRFYFRTTLRDGILRFYIVKGQGIV